MLLIATDMFVCHTGGPGVLIGGDSSELGKGSLWIAGGLAHGGLPWRVLRAGVSLFFGMYLVGAGGPL